MGLLKIFSIRSRPVFPFLVAGLALFSIGSWWSVKSSVDADVRLRLDSEAHRIETVLLNRLNTYANSLLHIRGHIVVDGKATPDDFGRLMKSLELPERYPGIMGVGYTRLLNPKQAAQAGLDTSNPDRKFYSQLQMLEPRDWRNERLLNSDPLADTGFAQAFLESTKSGEATLSYPVNFSHLLPALKQERVARSPLIRADKAVAKNPPTDEIGFSLALPIYASTTPIDTSAATMADVKGFLSAYFLADEFFKGSFGTPSMKKEIVNFSVALDGGNQPKQTLYTRFDLPSEYDRSGISATRTANLFGREITLHFTPLPHFYTFSDTYLPMAVGFGAAFISILILLILRATQNQLLYETRAKELILHAAKASKKQAELLNRFNEFARDISVEMDLELLVDKFFHLVIDLAQSQRSFLYFASYKGEEVQFHLKNRQGFECDELLKPILSLSEAMSINPNRFFIQKADRDSSVVIEQLIKSNSHLSDWLLIGIPALDHGRCGLLFIGRDDGSHFDEVEVELIESVVTQVASAIENAKLFRKAEDASLAKNAFLANMSHEIRTPLNAIVGFSEMILKRDVEAEQKESLADSIRRGGEQLTRLIDDILDLSKIEAGKLKIVMRDVELPAVIHELKSIMDLRAREKRVEFTIENLTQVPSHILTDDVRLKQILTNLVGNAIKFTEFGSVHLNVRFIKDETGCQFLAFRVKDTGIGISEEAQKELFQPFYQGDTSSTRRFGGSGLGLAISKRLCRELGGDLVLIESLQGQGSTFEARVAIGDCKDVTWIERLFESLPENEDKIRRSSRVQKLNEPRILLVEDSPDNQEIFRFFLESAGAKIELVDNGLDAVKKAASEHFDMILMDIQIPEIDGKEATRRIRNQGFDRPVVALTAHALAEERESCLAAGCDGQITKPVSGDDLVAEVAEYLRGNDERLSAYS